MKSATVTGCCIFAATLVDFQNMHTKFGSNRDNSKKLK